MNAHPAAPDIPVGAGPSVAASAAQRAADGPGAGPTDADGDLSDERVIPVIEERLKISRRSVETGAATRVRKVVRERIQDLDLPTWHDEVEVERVPIGRVVEGPVEVREEGDALVIPVVEERLVVRTERVLREEIRLTRRRRADHEVRAVRLRAEVAIVERLDPATGEWTEIESGTATGAEAVDGQAVPKLEASHEAPDDSASSRQPTPRTTIMYTVIGAFDDRQAAQRAFDKLIVQGFPRDCVDLQSRPATLDRAATTGDSSANDYSDVRRDDDEGFFAGVRHFFSSLFGTDDETQAGMYSEAIRRGGSVVVVDARDEQQADRAAEVLREQGGTIDLDERSASWRAEGWRDDAGREDAHRGITGGTAGAMAAQQLADEDRVVHTPGTEPNLASGTTATGPATRGLGAQRGTGTGTGIGGERDVVMPVVEEQARIGKRAVEQGGVRVVRRVTETPVSELVRLRQERARIDRRPADRAATSADLESFREGTVEVRERTEEPVVQKVARVVEEVVVGREVDERTERVEDKVRRTDVEIDRLARQADESLQRATGDEWNGDDVAGGPNPPPDVERPEPSLGEKLKSAVKRDDRPPSRH